MEKWIVEKWLRCEHVLHSEKDAENKVKVLKKEGEDNVRDIRIIHLTEATPTTKGKK